ncbi:PA1136 family autoinducer-binding transcriptional regulator [Comamonas terrae]|uniref:PA1136 family autoinducer-binding transcriptional regulator n=1 Tax=Comamonas terrae TaxID=673548 RepID=A0ABW5UT33_9BURK|nr:PA1136 family autoinducer-binding transcriptional regulator [Comamonas terrae]
MQELVRTVAAIEGSTNLRALARAVRAFAAPLGFDRFVLYSSQPSRQEVIEHVHWAEGDWFGDGSPVDAKAYLKSCPVNHHILETDRPFFWTKRGEPGTQTYRVVPSPRGIGIHGWQVPVFGPSGLIGAMSFGGRHVDDSLATRLALTLIGQAALRKAIALSAAARQARPSQLTPREQTVMRWMAAGKRQAETAAIMGLSERTIENHLRRIRLRLGATTTAEAVRMAIRSGDIAS